MLRRGLVLDLAIAGGTQLPLSITIYALYVAELKSGVIHDTNSSQGLGTTFGYLWWYGFHLPRVRRRDQFYAKLEDERAREAGFS